MALPHCLIVADCLTHSQKPPAFADMIRMHTPDLGCNERVEIFARQTTTQGFVHEGDQLDVYL